MDALYKVSLIPNDLSTEETVLQIANTLDNLNGVIEDAFSRLTARMKLYEEKTGRIQKRIDASNAKVESLKGTQKAIKVVSTSKYPADAYEPYESIFSGDRHEHDTGKIVLSGRSQGQTVDTDLQEKLHFFHVKVEQPKVRKPPYDLAAAVENMYSVGEILIFDTDESPYLPSESETLAVRTKPRPEAVKGGLDAPPASIARRDTFKREVDEFTYKPRIGNVPVFDMPTDLPDLPGIAGDVRFSLESEQSIAPSSAFTLTTSEAKTEIPESKPKLPELPVLEESVDAKSPVLVKEERIEASVKPIEDAKVVENVVELPETGMMTSAAIPPPPPPPPMPVDAEPFVPKISAKKDATASGGARAEDGHAQLMAAIRQVGGAGRAKLKSAAEATKSKGAPPPGGLMADLHAKLAMRRRGISGVAPAEPASTASRAAGTVLHTLASVIPPPIDQSPSISSTDDEWD